MMTTFTTEDRELVEKEPIPLYGYCCLTDPSPKDKNALLHPVLKKIKLEYRVDDSSEDLED
jgi:hypothetical protein